MRESYIQTKVTEFAVTLGLIPLRIAVTGRKGWPDYGYMYRERIYMIEFKRPGEKPEPLQSYVHKILRDAGCSVSVVDNIDYGESILKEWKTHVDSELATIRRHNHRGS